MGESTNFKQGVMPRQLGNGQSHCRSPGSSGIALG